MGALDWSHPDPSLDGPLSVLTPNLNARPVLVLNHGIMGSSRNEHMKMLIRECKTMQGSYWPFPLAFSADCQVIWMALTNLWRSRIQWDREIINLKDGQPVALDWSHPDPSLDGTSFQLFGRSGCSFQQEGTRRRPPG